MLVLGGPAVPPDEVRAGLIASGCREAALRGGDWVAMPWEGFTALGEDVLVDRRGYRDPDWQGVYRPLKVGRLERELANVPGAEVNARVFVYSTEDLGLSLVRETTLDDLILGHMGGCPREPTALECLKCPLNKKLGLWLGKALPIPFFFS